MTKIETLPRAELCETFMIVLQFGKEKSPRLQRRSQRSCVGAYKADDKNHATTGSLLGKDSEKESGEQMLKIQVGKCSVEGIM